jgi:glycosyltransferase involved in cell wall biosynthesis
MNKEDALLLGSLATIVVAETIKKRMKDSDSIVKKPVAPVSIIIPTYNEGIHIQQVCQSIRNQSIIKAYPDMFEIILVDSGSTDNTVQLATPYIDTIINAPRGKLTARNIGHNVAKGKIIWSVDGDCIYPENCLNTLLSDFNYPDVVAVIGSRLDDDYLPVFMQNWIYILDNLVGRTLIYPNRMSGHNCAYYKDMAGTFNENIDQLDIDQMIAEEETGFGEKLSKFGRIVYKINATCQHLGSERRICRLGIALSDKCNAIGSERF